MPKKRTEPSPIRCTSSAVPARVCAVASPPRGGCDGARSAHGSAADPSQLSGLLGARVALLLGCRRRDATLYTLPQRHPWR